MTRSTRHSGFTLVELIMVIVILGAIGGMVSVFMRGPIDAYLSSARRAALTDVADTTVRRIARDLRTALPNSIQVPSAQCLQFIPTKTGGRYRADDTATGLNFSAPDTSFNMLGSNAALPPNQRIANLDKIVVYNLGISGADAYAGSNVAIVSGTPTEAGTPLETTITIGSTQFPLASPNNRFHVVPSAEPVLAYFCSGSVLYRRAYSTNGNCTGTVLSQAVLARNVSACAFDYSGSDLQRNALVTIALQITDSGETVSLQQEVHVSNTP